MRLTCPLCGARDHREFSYKGAAVQRPGEGADLEAWHAYVNLRENPAGPLQELWFHQMGCGAWLKITRDTVTHEISNVVLASEAGLGGAA
ncbi:sarcosine oxidase subunit delta [Nocardioides marinus]|nr:sarcosine oxidase subunit delta [Nocardioides marinus]